jgi:hypothetical protein
MESRFIQLHRTFETFQSEETTDSTAHRSYIFSEQRLSAQFTWKSLLEYPLVVILGEPGSGKSEELKEQHRIHNGSFLLQLERLIREPVRAILEPSKLEQFEAWKSGDGDALFLLDAVDESKLQRDADFDTAVSRLRSELGLALPRARFVISSRVSEWRPQTDLITVTENLLSSPIEVTANKAKSGDDWLIEERPIASQGRVLVAVLQPLSPSQVRKFVEERGARDAEAFLSEIARSNTFSFAGRPLDVTHLHSYWLEKRHLNSLTDVVDFMVTKLLSELPEKEKMDVLSPSETREGAEHLAAAAILCRNLKFDISDPGYFNDDSRLSPSDILPENWPPLSRRALMNRAIFDSASRGSLAFHHRSHVEYLAAKWIERLMEKNCGFDDLRELLFAEIDGASILRASLAPICAWLINAKQEPWRTRLASLILSTSPEIHLQHGDPAVLPLQYKRRILAAITEKYKHRKQTGMRVSGDLLARLAEEALTEDINGYLVADDISDDLKTDLLMMVWEGHLSSCIESVIQLFSHKNTSEDLRSYCIHAVRIAGTLSHKRALAQLVLNQEALSYKEISYAFETLYPTSMTSEEALLLLKRADNISSYNYEFNDVIERHLSAVLQSSDAFEFLAGFLSMVTATPHGRNNISESYQWVLSLLPLCLLRALAASSVNDAEEKIVVETIQEIDNGLLYGYLDRHGKTLPLPELRECLEKRYQIRRKLFWHRLQALESPVRFDALPLHKLSPHNGLTSQHAGDMAWLLQDINSIFDVAHRRILMIFLLRLASENGLSKLKLALAMRRTLEVSELRKAFLRYLEYNLTAPIRLRWNRYFTHKLLDPNWWRAERISLLRTYAELRGRLWLWRHQTEIRSGKYPNVLAHMVGQLRSDGGTKFSVVDWSKATGKWGDRIATCVIEGCFSFWQKYLPQMPHEHQSPNSTDGKVIVGLVALQSLWKAKRIDFTAMNGVDVERAIRYACNEMNGFPEWFFDLAEARSDILEPILTAAIAAEFSYPDSLPHVHEVGAKLLSAPISIAAAQVAVMKVLSIGDAKNPKVLEQALSLLYQAGPNADLFLRDLAPTRISLYPVGRHQWILWMSAWMRADTLAAISHLQDLKNRDGDIAYSAMENLFSHLGGHIGRRHRIDNTSFLDPKVLAILVPLVYEYINPLFDIDRSNGGAYSPGPRDNAQDFRYRLFEILRSDESAEADNTLRILLRTKSVRPHYDWVLSILDERQGKLADSAPWLAEDVRTFAKKFVHEPRSDYQLYRLTYRLLTNIKNDIERPENASKRRQVREGDQEKDLQGLLLRDLNHQSLNWFSATQESEVDLSERPDIQVHRPGLNAIPVEIKLANLPHWNITKLLNGLDVQLVGQYLRPTKIRFGIYVVGTTSSKRQWELPDGTRIGFAELVNLLQSRAAELISERSNEVHGLEVIGIDFSTSKK